ncbi:uncharacterized protein [Nicotiana tomentosiformis]|uniref:uncharacterized protein n=1 Tax=Nicotiana tomentosiformis TaxID=4098 RepID=UPI00388CAC10
MAPAPTALPPAHPARGTVQSARGLLRWGGRSVSGQARFYALPARPDVIASDAVITVSSVHVSTSVGNTIIMDRVYRSCGVTIGGLETRVDLLLLSMVNFDMILGIDWLSPCHAVLDCHAKTVTLEMPGLLRVEWSGSIDYVPSRVISYLKAQQMVEKGCLSYLAFVRDVSAEVPVIDYVPMLCDFPDVFPVGMQGMPPDKDIDFGIDLVPGT